ncbi:MAG: hypothetical protein ACLVI6_08125 [Bifidobacterium bifidum]
MARLDVDVAPARSTTIRTQDGRTCARPRVWPGSPATIRDPATLLPALSRKTNAWPDSTIRDDFDNCVWRSTDGRQGAQERVPLISRTSDACGPDGRRAVSIWSGIC